MKAKPSAIEYKAVYSEVFVVGEVGQAGLYTKFTLIIECKIGQWESKGNRWQNDIFGPF